jgi:glycosyltransferase involved in cell wall biosynthesis
MQDQVDIIVPTYQGEKYLSELIDSLLNQTYSNIRILLRDDGSKDQTVPILNSYAFSNPEKIVLLTEPKSNLGIMGNYSELFKNTGSPYVFLADQDDVWLPNKVAQSMQVMKKMEQQFGKNKPLLVHTDLKVVDKNLKEISSSFWSYANLKPKLVTLNRLLLQNCITGCTIGINRPLIDLIMPVPKDAVMHDWWIGLVASYFGHIQHCEQATILYRQHSGNTLGAIKDDWVRVIKDKWFNRPEKNQARDQARAFLSLFGEKLDDKTKLMIKAFCSLKDTSYLHQRKQMISYGFFKHSTFRNAGRLFLPFRY